MRTGLVAALSVVALLVSTCSSAPTPGGPSATLNAHDQAIVDAFIAKGASKPEALVLSTTTIAVVAADDHAAHLLETFPTGDTADITISLTPAPAGVPGRVETTSAASPGGFTWTLSYFVPAATALADVANVELDQRESVLAATTENGSDVVVRVVVQKGAEAVLDTYLEHMQEFLDAEGKLDPMVQGLKVAGSIFDAIDLKSATEKLTKRIDALEKCARNPTNPLTIKAYQQDPTARDRLLQQVDAARLEVKANVAAEFIGLLNDTASDLTPAKWVGIVTAAGSAWARNTLDGLNERVVSDLEQSIVKCDEESPPPSEEPTPTSSTGDATCPPGSTDPACCPLSTCGSPAASAPHATRIAGTISWQLTKDLEAVSGSATMTLISTDDFDFVVQPGSTYSLDITTQNCGSAHKEGVLKQFIPAGNPPALGPGEGSLGVVGGPGRDLSMTILLLHDNYPCPDVADAVANPVGFPGCPYFSKVIGKFSPGSSETYDFSCESNGQFGITGSVHGTLTPAQ